MRYLVLRKIRSARFDRLGGDQMAFDEEPGGVELVAEDIPISSIADLERDPLTLAGAPAMPVELIRPSQATAPAGAEDDPQWGTDAVGARASAFDGRGVRIAVLDTGIDRDHPAFAGMALVEEDFTGEGVGDMNGHGTHCAGTIFGRDINGRIGVARGVGDALIGKVLDANGNGTSEAVLKALHWAQGRNANIVSMSLGFAPAKMADRLRSAGWPEAAALSQALQAYGRNLRLFDAWMAENRAERARAREMLIVAATGNDSARAIDPRFRVGASLPSAAHDVVSVGALAKTDAGLSVASFSNTMPTLCAPGVAIRSAWRGGGVATLDGTSMACPHVAGVAALWWQSLGARASAEIVRSKLVGETSVTELARGYDHTDVGYGLVRSP